MAADRLARVGGVCPSPIATLMPAAVIRPKERARRAIESLPESASLEDAIERLVVLHKVERGLAEVRSGDGLMTQAEVEAHFAKRRAEQAG